MKIKGSSARGRELVNSDRYAGKYLSDVYKSCSVAKANAFRGCLIAYKDCPRSYNFHIRSYNSWGFTVAWNWFDEEANSRVYTMVTPYNRYDVYLDI